MTFRRDLVSLIAVATLLAPSHTLAREIPPDIARKCSEIKELATVVAQLFVKNEHTKAVYSVIYVLTSDGIRYIDTTHIPFAIGTGSEIPVIYNKCEESKEEAKKYLAFSFLFLYHFFNPFF